MIHTDKKIISIDPLIWADDSIMNILFHVYISGYILDD